MTEVPKIVYDRLRAPERIVPAHPDADLLAGFAEQALATTEREGVLEHLVVCAECREVVALALPGVDEMAARVANETGVRGAGSRSGAPAPHKASFGWSSLRWAALAAGVVVAASLLLLHPGKLNQAVVPTAQKPAASAAPASQTQMALSSTNQFAASDNAKTSALPAPSQTAKKLRTRPTSSGMALEAAIPKQSVANSPNDALDSVAASALPTEPRSINETVEVSSESAAVEVSPSPEGSVIAQNEAPAIEKAKPVPQQVVTEADAQSQQVASTAADRGSTSNNMAVGAHALQLPLSGRNVMALRALVPAATWAIKNGVLQRSLDNGQSWQNSLQADRPLTCYATQDGDVWAGGPAGTLFHSFDGGLTWKQVHPSIEGRALSGDITRLDLQSDNLPASTTETTPGNAKVSREIVVLTTSKEVWSSGDAGNTWNKK